MEGNKRSFSNRPCDTRPKLSTNVVYVAQKENRYLTLSPNLEYQCFEEHDSRGVLNEFGRIPIVVTETNVIISYGEMSIS